VIHLAASVGEANINNVYTGFQINLVAAINVAEAVRLAGVRKLVHASTQAVYSGEDPKELLREDSPIDCRERVYNASKIGCEHVLRTYSAKHKIELGAAAFCRRLRLPFGLRRPRSGGATGDMGCHGEQIGDAQRL
jgi:nucleoside-diphosphate-sugar epimerase